jgi:hypothetical protein
MLRSVPLSKNSWRQPFDRKDTVNRWNVNPTVARECNVHDETKRLINIRFEGDIDINETMPLTITSGHEMYFPAEFAGKIKDIISNTSGSFIATIIDVCEYAPNRISAANGNLSLNLDDVPAGSTEKEVEINHDTQLTMNKNTGNKQRPSVPIILIVITWILFIIAVLPVYRVSELQNMNEGQRFLGTILDIAIVIMSIKLITNKSITAKIHGAIILTILILYILIVFMFFG